MEAIISAKELYEATFKGLNIEDNEHLIPRMMVQFAKIHRKEILEEIADDYLCYLVGSEGSEILDKNRFFKEVYPENNIK